MTADDIDMLLAGGLAPEVILGEFATALPDKAPLIEVFTRRGPHTADAVRTFVKALAGALRKERRREQNKAEVHAAKPLQRRPKGARVIPFPSARRSAFVRKQAEMMAGMPAESGEAYLRSQLAIQGNTMRRKGIDEAAIARVLRDLQGVIRAELFRSILLSNPRDPA
jgi:hypothetical protein